MLLTTGIMVIQGYTGCMLGLASRVFAYTSLAPPLEDLTSLLNLNKNDPLAYCSSSRQTAAQNVSF